MSHSFDPSRVAQVLTYLKANPTHGERRVSTAVGISRPSAQRIINAYRAGRLNASAILAQTAPADVPAPGIRSDTRDNSHEIVSKNPRTLADLVKVCEVDLKVWRIARHVVNKWEVGVKQDDGTVLTSPLFQIKVWLEPLPGAQDAQVIRDTIEWIKNQAVVPTKPRRPALASLSVDDPHLLEISIFDHHFGKLGWHEETGYESYDTNIAASLYMEAVRNLWHKASVFPISKILLPVGNDLLHTDNAEGTTTAGTPQHCDGRWQRSFRRAVACVKEQIEFLRGKASDGIEVMIVPGNHDQTTSFFLGEVIAAIYSKAEDVRVNNVPRQRKYYRYGSVLLGFCHGHREKHDKLPLIMAGEAPRDWAETTSREFHVGHVHQTRETRYHAGSEHGPVRVRVLPSLSGADAWHSENGYVGSKRAAEAYIYARDEGYVGHFSWSPKNANAIDPRVVTAAA
jgi:hypothetical protein